MTGVGWPGGSIWMVVSLRGATMLGLGLVALLAKEDQLAIAMRSVGQVVILTALVEAVLLGREQAHTTAWWLTAGEAFIALTYGALTLLVLSVLRASPIRAIAAVDCWLLASSVFACLLMLHAWDHQVVRLALLAWASLSVVLAVAGALDPPVAIAGLVYGGALYTAVFGAMELAGAVWLARLSQHSSVVTHVMSR